MKKEGSTIPADGLWLSPASGFYFTSPEDNAVKRRGADGQMATIVQDKRLRWPDSMAEGPDGKPLRDLVAHPGQRLVQAGCASIALKTHALELRAVEVAARSGRVAAGQPVRARTLSRWAV